MRRIHHPSGEEQSTSKVCVCVCAPGNTILCITELLALGRATSPYRPFFRLRRRCPALRISIGTCGVLPPGQTLDRRFEDDGRDLRDSCRLQVGLICLSTYLLGKQVLGGVSQSSSMFRQRLCPLNLIITTNSKNREPRCQFTPTCAALERTCGACASNTPHTRYCLLLLP